RALERDLQVLDLAEVALEHATGLACGLHHHVEKGGASHRVDVAGRSNARQGRDDDIEAIHGFAAFSPASRSAGASFRTNSSSQESERPAALATMCHLAASTGLAGTPRPAARMRAYRFWATALPRLAALRMMAAAPASSLAMPTPLNSAM